LLNVLENKVEKMAKIYIERLGIPQKSFRDAAHLALASNITLIIL